MSVQVCISNVFNLSGLLVTTPSGVTTRNGSGWNGSLCAAAHDVAEPVVPKMIPKCSTGKGEECWRRNRAHAVLLYIQLNVKGSSSSCSAPSAVLH